MRVAGRGVSWQTVAGRATVAGFPGLFRGGATAAVDPIAASGASHWFDALNLTSGTQQSLPNRISGDPATFGSNPSAEDTNDPVRLVHDGTDYVYLPGTAGNNLSIPKGVGWAGTLHVTATRTDDTTATFTTTADPVLIGDTLLAAGSYRLFTVRDTDASGTVRATIEPNAETLGQTSWTATTGQTVTVNRSTTGLRTAVVTSSIGLFDDVDDYGQLPADSTPSFTATSGAFTSLLMLRYTGQPASGRQLWSATPSNVNGPFIRTFTNTNKGVQVSGSIVSATATVAGASMNTIDAVAMVVDNGALAGWGPSSGMTSPIDMTGVGDILFSQPRLNTRAFSSPIPPGMEWFSYVQWPRALTAQELTDAYNYLLSLRS